MLFIFKMEENPDKFKDKPSSVLTLHTLSNEPKTLHYKI